jgi:ubiquilin
MKIQIKVKTTSGKQFEVDDIDTTCIVRELKEYLVNGSGVEASQQRIVFKGRILKDDLSLEHYQIYDNATIHLVRALPSSSNSSQPSQTTPQIPRSATTSSTPAGENRGFGLGGLGGGMFGGGGNLNAGSMQQMLNSPVMQNLLSQPEVLREMMLMNPQLRAMMEANPQLVQALNDPQTLRQIMEAMRNPNVMQEMMRNQDVAMANIESMPGGYNALRRMYEEIQEPLMNSSSTTTATPRPFGAPSTSVNTNTTTATTQTGIPNNTPMPNPWGRASSNNNSTTAPALANFGGLGGLGSQQGLFPGAGLGGGGFSAPPMDPALLGQMAQNPLFRTMMKQMLSSPEYVDHMARMNPIFNDPTVRAQLQDPNFIDRISDPAFMQTMLQFNQTMSQFQPPHGSSTSPNALFSFLTPGNGGISAPSFVPPTPVSTTNQINPWATLTPPSTTLSTNNQQPSEERFVRELAQLETMGFTDRQKNIQVCFSSNLNIFLFLHNFLKIGFNPCQWEY